MSIFCVTQSRCPINSSNNQSKGANVPDDKAKKAVDEVLQRGAALVDALNLTPVEMEYAMVESQHIITQVTDKYFNDAELKGRNVRPIAVVAAVAFSLTYFDKWVAEMERKFPDLGER
jgi:hypothetical protein